jgi:hypothetical protein
MGLALVYSTRTLTLLVDTSTRTLTASVDRLVRAVIADTHATWCVMTTGVDFTGTLPLLVLVDTIN